MDDVKEIPVPVRVKKLLTCPVCRAKLARLAIGWGCRKQLSHTRIIEDVRVLDSLLKSLDERDAREMLAALKERNLTDG